MANSGESSGAVSNRYIFQLSLSTLPMFLVLCYFLVIAHERPKDPYYSDDIDDDAVLREIGRPHFDLLEMLWIFVTTLLMWSTLLVYLVLFVPRRRKLIALYAETGEIVFGDVEFDDDAGCGDCKMSWLPWNCSACCGFFASDFADLVYTIDVPAEGGRGGATDKATVRKVVRTYKPWYRERVPILILPGMPKSGLPKSDVETDIKSQGANRVRDLYFVIGYWIVFLILGSLYLVFQIPKVHDELYHVKQGWILFGVSMVLNFPIAYVVNALRFWHYKKWLTNSGKMQIDTSTSTRKKDDSFADPEGPSDNYQAFT